MVDCGVGLEGHIQQTKSLFSNVKNFKTDNMGYSVNMLYFALRSLVLRMLGSRVLGFEGA